MRGQSFISTRKNFCDKRYPLRDRLRLYNSVVTPTVLYGSGVWTMTKELERLLRTAQRRMLRKILAMGRAVVMPSDSEVSSETSVEHSCESVDEEHKEHLEDWVTWIQRTTHMSQDIMAKLKIEDCVKAQRRRKFTWTGHVGRRTDCRWSTMITNWHPTEGSRTRGRQYKRWSDAFDDFSVAMGLERGLWKALVTNVKEWKVFEDTFVNYGFD